MRFGQSTRLDFSNFAEKIKPYSGKNIAVGVSGGADSLALLFLLVEKGFNPFILTVNHGVRKSAILEIDHVAKIAARLKLPHHILSAQHLKTPPQTQAAARNLRFSLLSQWCKLNKIRYCALAHHQQDQVETFLFRLARGSGVEGLAAMQPEIVYNQCHFIRPLLETSPKNLTTFLQEKEIDWCCDPSNTAPQFARTHLRVLIKNLQFDVGQFAAASSGANIVRQELTKRVLAFLNQHATTYDAGYCALDEIAFNRLPMFFAKQVLAYLIKWINGEFFHPRTQSLERLWAQLKLISKTQTAVLGGCQIIKKTGSFMFFRELARTAPRQKLQAGQNIWDNRFCLNLNDESDLIKNTEIGALGHYEALPSMNSSIPKIAHNSLPALWQGDKLVAAPQLGIGSKVAINFLRPQAFSAKSL